MKKIKEYVDYIDDEIEGAKEYAEKYIEFKARGITNWATSFKDMASQELNHATTIHDIAVKEIEDLKKVFVVPKEMQDVWDEEHKNYVEKVAWIKQMLTM